MEIPDKEGERDNLMSTGVNFLSRGSFGYRGMKQRQATIVAALHAIFAYIIIIIYALFDAAVEVSVECYKLKRYIIVTSNKMDHLHKYELPF